MTTLPATPCPSGDETGSVQVDQSAGLLAVGQWYWVKDTRRTWNKSTEEHDELEYEWLGCAMFIGSNFVEVQHPSSDRNPGGTMRVHFDNCWKVLRHEPNPDPVIRGKIAYFQAEVTGHLESIKAITARLGVANTGALADRSAGAGAASDGALVVMSGQSDIKGYQAALVRASSEELPALFEAVKKANGEVARWMSAGTLPMLAMSGGLHSVIDEIKGRIFNVSLYAGLTEEVVSCCGGEPAAFHEKLHVMQRRLYIDEECLLNYRHGGMEFRHIEEFDAWIATPVNRERILPFPRCMVAMRVRRNTKEREWDGSLLQAYINVHLANADKLTFLYIRNGDRVSRLSCDLEFGELIFPDKSSFDPGRPMMVKLFCHKVDKMITRDDYEERLAAYEEREAASRQWEAEHPADTWSEEEWGTRWMANPHRDTREFQPSDWKPFDPSNLYFDEVSDEIAKRMEKYNRVALIIQGLYDRSEALHPHPPVKTWTPEGFAAAIELVYDGAAVLVNGAAPDFEAYRAGCNESLGAESVVIGQELFWLKKEAAKERRRMDADWRTKSTDRRPEKFRPYGNPGPGYLGRPAQWKARSRSAVFTWVRKRRNNRYGEFSREIPVSLAVPASALFNVSAYRLGDYLQFFQDHRTRAQYLQWAPMLLAAEEFHAGTFKLPNGGNGE